jgi:hypothetical protein
MWKPWVDSSLSGHPVENPKRPSRNGVFAEMEDYYNNTFNTVLFLGGNRNIYKTLAAWTTYAKLTAIKVLENKGQNFECTLIGIKKLVYILELCLVPTTHIERMAQKMLTTNIT